MPADRPPLPHYDLAIVGTGSGNSILSPEFDDWSVAMCERDVFGGTCLNRGCIPSKMFIYAADVAQHARHASRLGVDMTLDGVRWADIRDRVFGRIDPIAEAGDRYRTDECANVTVYRGDAHFRGPRHLAVGHEEFTADRVVLAAGARPWIPPIPGLDTVDYHTSDTIMRLDELPERLVVLGGGYIGAELAHVFDAFGVQVRVVNRSPVLLRHEDDDVSRRFTRTVGERLDLHMDVTVDVVRPWGGGVELDLDDGARVEGDVLLIATGRVPNGDLLHVEAGGVERHVDGRVVVDATGATTAPGVWALGDVSSPHQLKHVANHEAAVVAHNLLHPDHPREIDHRAVPHAVFGDPQVASVGMTERQARASGVDYSVAIREYGDTAYGWAMEDRTSFCKVIAGPDRTLLGAHLMGPHASTLIQQLIQGMRMGLTVDEMATGQLYIHPALTEVVEQALLDL